MASLVTINGKKKFQSIPETTQSGVPIPNQSPQQTAEYCINYCSKTNIALTVRQTGHKQNYSVVTVVCLFSLATVISGCNVVHGLDAPNDDDDDD